MTFCVWAYGSRNQGGLGHWAAPGPGLPGSGGRPVFLADAGSLVAFQSISADLTPAELALDFRAGFSFICSRCAALYALQ